MYDRQNIDAKAAVILTAICMIWGMQQIVMKLAAPDVPPVLQVGLRSAVGALPLIVFIRLKGRPVFPRDGSLGAGVIFGIIYGVQFYLICEGLLRTSAAHGAIFIYTSPLFTAVGLHFFLPQERLSRAQWCGLAAAFAGIVIAFAGGSPLPPELRRSVLLGDLLCLAGGFLWGSSTIFLRRSSLAEATAAHTALYQLLGGAAVLLSLALLTGEDYFRFTPLALGSMAFHVLLVACGGMVAWLWLLCKYLAAPLSALTFMTPVFGVLFGVMILGEKLDGNFVLGSLLILAGLLLVTAWPWLRRHRPHSGS